MTGDERLQSLIHDLDDPQRRDEAIQSLGALRDPRAVDPLVAVLRAPGEGHALAYRARQLAAAALGEIGEMRALPALIVALEDTSSAVKISAALALGKLNDARAADSLETALGDSSAGVRSAALEAIGMLGKDHEVGIPPIIQRLADVEDEVRGVAERVLRELSGKAFDGLLAALNDPNSTIRGAAANLLGELKDERARDALRKVSYDDESKWVRSRAEWALSQLPKPAFPTVQRDHVPKAPDSPRSALEVIRAQVPKSYPSLRPQPATQPDPANMTAEQVQAMLDQLDIRLANGEISEATYQRLAQRWEERLKQLKG